MPHGSIKKRARIIGTGSAVPDKVVTNTDLEEFVDTTDEWITTRTGIEERRIAVGESSTGLATLAAKRAMEAAGVTSDDIDMVIVGTVTPDMVFPSTACLVQDALGIKSGVPAFDVSAACSGFIFPLDIAERYVRSGASKCALVIGVDLFSRILDWSDRATCVLFGDGAGAVILKGVSEERGILSSRIHSDGSGWRKLFVPGAFAPSLFETRGEEAAYMQMNGNETFRIAVRTMVGVCEETLEDSGLSIDDISLLIPHQANLRILNAVSRKLGLKEDQVCVNIEKYGNTSAGSIPMALDDSVRAGRVKKGDILIFVVFGAGLTWGSTVVKW